MNFDLLSSARYEVMSTASMIQPQDLSSGHAEVSTGQEIQSDGRRLSIDPINKTREQMTELIY